MPNDNKNIPNQQPHKDKDKEQNPSQRPGQGREDHSNPKDESANQKKKDA